MLLARLAQTNVDSICVLGSTGSYAYLTTDQRLKAAELAAEAVDGKRPLIVGVGALSTRETVSLAKGASQAGADGLLLAPVSYNPLTDDEVYEHFLKVAKATDLPLCIYNNPGITHFTFSLPLLERLAQIDTITAVKMPLPQNDDFANDLKTLRAAMPQDFRVGYSGDWGCSKALLSGADAWFSVLGGLMPEPCLKLHNAAKSGDEAQMQRLEAAFAPMWVLFKQYGSVRIVYAAAQYLQLTQANAPRPLLPINEAAHAKVVEAVEALVQL